VFPVFIYSVPVLTSFLRVFLAQRTPVVYDRLALYVVSVPALCEHWEGAECPAYAPGTGAVGGTVPFRICSLLPLLQALMGL